MEYFHIPLLTIILSIYTQFSRPLFYNSCAMRCTLFTTRCVLCMFVYHYYRKKCSYLCIYHV